MVVRVFMLPSLIYNQYWTLIVGVNIYVCIGETLVHLGLHTCAVHVYIFWTHTDDRSQQVSIQE